MHAYGHLLVGPQAHPGPSGDVHAAGAQQHSFSHVSAAGTHTMFSYTAKLRPDTVFLDRLAGVALVQTSNTKVAAKSSDLTITFSSTAACKAAVANLTVLSAVIVIEASLFGVEPNTVYGYPVPAQIHSQVVGAAVGGGGGGPPPGLLETAICKNTIR